MWMKTISGCLAIVKGVFALALTLLSAQAVLAAPSDKAASHSKAASSSRAASSGKAPPSPSVGASVSTRSPQARMAFQRAYALRNGPYAADRAISEIDRAIALEPGNAQFLALKAEILYSVEEDEESLSAAELAIKSDPNCVSAWFCKARILTRLKRAEEGLKCMNRVMELQAPDAGVYDARGRIFAVLNRWSEAASDFDHAVKLLPHSGTFLSDRLDAYLRVKDYARAVEDATSCLTLEPRNLQSFYKRRAEAYVGLHQYDKAESDYKEAVKRSPDDVRLREAFRSFYQQTGNAAGAKEQEKKLNEIYGDIIRR